MKVIELCKYAPQTNKIFIGLKSNVCVCVHYCVCSGEEELKEVDNLWD